MRSRGTYMKYQENYNVKFHDTDVNEVVSISHILKFMQETSMRHMRARKPSYEELFNDKKALFVLLSFMDCYYFFYEVMRKK